MGGGRRRRPRSSTTSRSLSVSMGGRAIPGLHPSCSPLTLLSSAIVFSFLGSDVGGEIGGRTMEEGDDGERCAMGGGVPSSGVANTVSDESFF